MKKEKHIKQSAHIEENMMQEPEVAYNAPVIAKKHSSTQVAYINPVRRSLVLMGLQNEEATKNLNSKNDFINYIRKGVPKKALDNLTGVTGFSGIEMANILHTTDRTLRRYTSNQKLNAEQSERLIEVAKLYARGEDVFDGLEVFKTWMDTPVVALGNEKPKTFLDTSLGIGLLMDELGRIEHGIFA